MLCSLVSVSFESSGASTKDAQGHWAKRSKKVGGGGGGGGGAGKERKCLPLSPDILRNAPKWLHSLGAYTVMSNEMSHENQLFLTSENRIAAGNLFTP